jgi:hypothetical protein
VVPCPSPAATYSRPGPALAVVLLIFRCPPIIAGSAPRPPLPCRLPVSAIPHASSCSQWRVRVVGSLVPSVPLARPSSHSTPVHPTSKGSWRWLGGAVVVGFGSLGRPLLMVIVLPPAIHPTSSCSWAWGRVVSFVRLRRFPSRHLPLPHPLPSSSSSSAGNTRIPPYKQWLVGLGRVPSRPFPVVPSFLSHPCPFGSPVHPRSLSAILSLV